jgi:phosphatidylethanolamine-binding protein (PEBP) family uncharacterized protein
MEGRVRSTAIRTWGHVSPSALLGLRRSPAALRRLRRGAYPAALLATAVIAGCGGGGPSSTSPSVPAAPGSSPVASTQASASTADTVALVAHTPIPKSSYAHWLAVEHALGSGPTSSHRALGFLITSTWVLSEAAARGISVSEAEVKSRFAELVHQDFAKAGSLKKFLTTSRQTEADLLGRVKVELLESRIAAKVAAGKSASQRKSALASFQQAFQQRWKSHTTCHPGYVMEDCSEYHGKPENLAPTSSSSNSSSSSSSPNSSSTTAARSGSSASRSSASNSASASSGEVYTAPGAMAISSPAFGRNGPIPAQYTCDGANTSPPLEWHNVPAKAAALVLFIIDDTSTGSASGIRWVVGDISPTAKGVAAGAVPEGGIVGSDTQGHSGYGGICPAHGQTSTVQFVLYALNKKIPLSPGFEPAVAESEYGSGKDLLGEAAVTYAVYHRS